MMPSEVLVPLVSGLLGALIGASGSVATVWIQSRHETKRHRIRVAVEAGMREAADQHEIARAKLAAGVGSTIPPLALYVFHYAEVLKLLESGDLTPDSWRDLMARQRRFHAAMVEVDDGLRRT